jgi:hypothetical protein
LKKTYLHREIMRDACNRKICLCRFIVISTCVDVLLLKKISAIEKPILSIFFLEFTQFWFCQYFD